MRLLTDLTDLRKKTIAFWSTYSYPGNPLDISRVYAFRELDLETATNEQVSAAYGGDGWAPQTPCAECGMEAGVELGGICFCSSCLQTANALLNVTPTNVSIFSRLFSKG